MHYACVQYKDMCGRAYDIRKRKTSGTAPNCNSGLYADYAVNLECITHVSNTKIEVRPEHTISEKERHPGTAPDSISGLYAVNFRLLYSAYLPNDSDTLVPIHPFRLCLPIANRPHCRRPDYFPPRGRWQKRDAAAQKMNDG